MSKLDVIERHILQAKALLDRGYLEGEDCRFILQVAEPLLKVVRAAKASHTGDPTWEPGCPICEALAELEAP